MYQQLTCCSCIIEELKIDQERLILHKNEEKLVLIFLLWILQPLASTSWMKVWESCWNKPFACKISRAKSHQSDAVRKSVFQVWANGVVDRYSWLTGEQIKRRQNILRNLERREGYIIPAFLRGNIFWERGRGERRKGRFPAF